MKHIAAGIGLLVGGILTIKAMVAHPNANTFVQAFTGYNMWDKSWGLDDFHFLPGYVGVGVSVGAAKFGVNKYTPKGVNL